MQIREAMPAFVDEMTKLSASKQEKRVRKILPLLTLGGAATGATVGALSSRKLPSAQRLRHIANVTALGTSIGWTPDVVYSGLKAAKK